MNEKIAKLHMEGLDIYEIAKALGIPWPHVHVAVFDMKRAIRLGKGLRA